MEDINERKIYAIAFGQIIKHERKLKGWSQSELSDQAQILASTISRLERGEVLPDLYNIHQLEKAFDFKSGELSIYVEYVLDYSEKQTLSTISGAGVALGVWWFVLGDFAGITAVTALIITAINRRPIGLN